VKIPRTAIVSLALLVACGGDDKGSPTDPGGNSNTVSGDGNITATVNGTAWRSSKAGDHVTRTGQFYGISAVNPPYALILGIGNVTSTGTFSLNLATGNGSSAIISNSTGGWGTAFTGGTGSITVTVLTATRIAGTFSFDAVPGSGSATGTMQVRNGAFDLTF
jgi:hypothetical protein